MDKEFALFKEAEQERTQRIQQQAKLLKLVAAIVVALVFALVAALLFYWMRARGLQTR
jgi:membrane protein insertase Oxa1/YidC/SpoIIIJ